MTTEETNRLLFGQGGHMYRGVKNRLQAMDAHALVILHTDGTYEVIKNVHAGLNFGAAVSAPTVLYLRRDCIKVLSIDTGRVRLHQPCVSEVNKT